MTTAASPQVIRRPGRIGWILLPLGFLIFLALAGLTLLLLAPDTRVPTSPERLLPPLSPGHVFGTDNLGRDIALRLLFGIVPTFIVGILGAGIATLVGAAAGIASGFSVGWLDSLIMRLGEFFQILPLFIVAVLVATFVGGGAVQVGIVVGLLMWPRMARVVRATVIGLREAPYVTAARLAGMPWWRIAVTEILPAARGQILVIAALEAASAILIESGLSYLGLGDPNWTTWGSMLQEAQRHFTRAPWVSLFPGVAIALVVISLNLIGDAWGDRAILKGKEGVE